MTPVSLMVACWQQSNVAARGGTLDNFKDLYGAEAIFTRESRDIAALVKRGEQVATTVNEKAGFRCQSCHRMPGCNAITGPSFYGVGKRYAERLGSELRAKVWLFNKISEPDAFPGLNSAYFGSGIMFPMKDYYSPTDIEALVEYLMTLPAE
ncbi:MAG: cytochrome c [Planctomycetes bacterium]|nr:cytochrome c [Planctomycetota bacterium]